MTLGDHDHGSKSEFVNIGCLSCLDRNLNNIVDLCVGIRVSESASVVRDSAWNFVGTNVDLVDSAKLVICLGSVKFYNRKEKKNGSWTEEAFEAPPCAKALEHRKDGRCLGSQTFPGTSQAS